MSGKLASTRTNSCSAALSYRTGDHTLLAGAEKRLHLVPIEPKLVLHQSDTHSDQARKQSHSINAHNSPKYMPSRCLNPRATYLDFALLIQPNSSDFQLDSHSASITLPIGYYAGPNVLDCSRPRNYRVLEPRHISACSDDSASETVGGIGTSLAGAVGRSASGGGNSCSRKASSNALRVAIPCTNAAWDIRPMLWGDSLIARVSPRVRPGIRTSASCPSLRTTRSGIEAGGGGIAARVRR